jgi:uncharacterized phage protein gp47/JayE
VLLDEVQRAYPDGTPAGAWWVPARLGGGAASAEEADAFLRRLAERWQVPPGTTATRCRRTAAGDAAPGSVDAEVEVDAAEPGDEEQAS